MKVRAFNDESKSFVSAKLIELENMEIIDERGFDLSWFTGLKDSNGVEIYEGDIVSDNIGTGRVAYAGDCAAFKVSYLGKERGIGKWFMDYLAREFKTIEVIGNTYQNPELIENNN